jgi:aliphatic nitrilase
VWAVAERLATQDAEVDLRRGIEPKQFHDVVGYNNRFDVFVLNVNRKRLMRDVDRRFQIRNLTARAQENPEV